MPMQRMTVTQMLKRARCSRCGRRVKGDPDANVTMRDGVAVGFTCSACQTDEEHLEAEVNDATTDYGRTTTDAFGRLVAPPKSPEPGGDER